MYVTKLYFINLTESVKNSKGIFYKFVIMNSLISSFILSDTFEILQFNY